MRTSEWIQIGFPLLLTVAAWVQPVFARPLPIRRRWNITLLATVPCLAVAAVLGSARFFPAPALSPARDWLAVLLFLVPYWQTGQFFQGPNREIEKRLMNFDRWFLPRVAQASGTPRTATGMLLEIAYLFCYPLVPLGLATLYALHQRQNVDGFWLVVLLATYICYAVTPFVPAYPPRDLATQKAATGPAGKTRIFNRWILKHGSIHAISFPSAHVASGFAVSLVLLRYTPYAGALFLLISIAIALGALLGRYHYALDVLLGAVTALMVFLVCYTYL